MHKPNFFIVGAPRSGTTSMYIYLKQHPEIYVSVDKEPHFFGSDLSPLPGAIREEPLYLEFFAGAGDRPRIGEASVWYLGSARAPFEIRAFSPQARIVIMLREPVQMAYSLYSLFRRTGNEDLPTFEAAVAAEAERRQGRCLPPGVYFPEGLLYTDVARYATKVARYFAVFGRENVHCVLFDDFTRDTATAFRQTLEFLGVDPRFEAELDVRQANQLARISAIRQLRHISPELRQRMQFKEMKLHEGKPSGPLPAALAARLRELFAEDVARLGALLGRDLGAWTRGEALAPTAAATKPPSDARLRVVLDGVRALRRIPPEIRAQRGETETLERKFARWQRLRVPDLPLVQRPYTPEWVTWFADERERIAGALRRPALRIEHFGSTAVPGLSSKNIIDIAVRTDLPSDDPGIAAALAGIGYESYGNSPVDPETLWFWRLVDDRAYAVHLCQQGQWFDDQVDLRDYLTVHAAERDRYAELKRQLAEEIDKSFLQYSIRKMSLSIEMVARAKEWRARGGDRRSSGEMRSVDDEALMGADADRAAGRHDLDLEAE